MEFQRLGPSIPFSGLSRQEILHAAANRLLYSKFFMAYFVFLYILGLITLITAFIERCPSLFFIVIESILCICMILEIITRGVAMGQAFFRSWWNYFDIIIVFFCGLTLILLTRGCSDNANSEELINTILLVIRNAAQFFRLLAAIRKNRRQMDSRTMDIDIDNNPEFMDIIGDIDDLVPEPEFGGYTSGGDEHEFRISIDSLEGINGSNIGFDGENHTSNLHRIGSHSSALSSRHSTPDVLTGRRKGSGK